MKKLYFIILTVAFFSCQEKKIEISNLSNTSVGKFASEELNTFLSKVYTQTTFETSDGNTAANIQLVLTDQAREMGFEDLPSEKESFKILESEEVLYIVSPDERGLLNGVYGLLEKLDYGFYLSYDKIPEERQWEGFAGWEFQDKPLTGDRILFNWHNFLSGCTGWNLEDWETWIDQANKMKYNSVMIHAYGNNPIFSFEYLGEKKQTGYLNNTRSGRDWGNQHMNDVRRLVGGDIFEDEVFGASASMADEAHKEQAATEFMQHVFQYAEERGTNVIFALDFDTWMSIPQNIVKKMPKEAVFELDGYLAPNPDHPVGFAYYREIVKTLMEKYPEIDQLSVWHRRPREGNDIGSIWMLFPYEEFPEDWKVGYKQKLADNPAIEDNIYASSMFAFGKLIEAVQRARDEVAPELKISSGSWRFDYVPYADAMLKEDIPIIPLDWEVIFHTDRIQKSLSAAGKNREVYPIIWGHHDDHRYLGKPYTPWENLLDKLEARNSAGFGIIHWTTRPLDLYFTSNIRQVWDATQNEPLKKTVDNYVSVNFGADAALSDYYYNWLTEGPMFGKETSDHLIDLGRQQAGEKLESWSLMLEKTKDRIKRLDEITNIEDHAYLRYQRAMEEYYISFFENQKLFDEVYRLTNEKEIEKARELIVQAQPEETIKQYIDAVQNVGFTSGEKAMVVSMNARWRTDFKNIRQSLGLENVYLKFAPTYHDPLAQAPGVYSYFIDENDNWYRCLWENELKDLEFAETEKGSFLKVDEALTFPITSMHGQELNASEYMVKINYSYKGEQGNVELSDADSADIQDEVLVKVLNGNLEVRTKGDSFYLEEMVIMPTKK